jgi:branched-chain amino acid transport system permease protein
VDRHLLTSRATVAFLAVAILLAALPWLKLPAFYESFLYVMFHWVVLATSWNILSGYSGYFSFGHGAFFGIGMYTTAVMAGKLGLPFLWTLPAAAAISALAGVALGAVVFRVRRLRGELFALLTLAVAYVLATLVLNTPIDGGPGVYLSAVPLPALGPSPASSFYLMSMILAVVTLWIARAIWFSRFGTGLFAIHDDEDVAEVSGVPTYRFKLMAFALSCALAAMAGGIQAVFVSYVTVGETFSIIVPLYVVLMSVLGGAAHWFGPAIGAALITGLLFAFSAGDSAVAGRATVGLILIVVILFMPGGVLGRFARRQVKQPEANAGAATPGDGVIAAQGEAATPTKPDSTGMGNHLPRGETLLHLREVSKSFSGLQALSNVEIEVRRGEILGLVGPNGSGKSTLINVVSGHYRADGGSIRYLGQELLGAPAHRVARAGIARTYQIPRPFARMSVLENVALAAMFGHAAMDRLNAEREAWRCLEFTGLAARAALLPEDLNLHQRKFLELARALASNPSLIFLDEVLSGLTPGEIDEAIRMVRAIRDRGATVVFVEHVMRAVMELTDRVVVLNHGKVIAEGLPREVMARPEVVTAYLGRAHA